MTKVYEYSKCSTCKNAIVFLEQNKINYQKLAIVDSPPSIKELKAALQFLKSKNLNLKKLFNTSGLVYKELKLSEKFEKGLSEDQALKLLSENGKLIKRPFVILEDSSILVGFKKDDWKKAFKIS
jgi:arsenate reductase